jgi:small subunit ribosomal protein S1
LANDDKSNQEEDFAALFAASERSSLGQRGRQRPEVGARVRGKVVSIGREVVFLELENGQGEGMLDMVELRDERGQVTVAAGDVVEATVVEGGEGRGSSGALILRRGLGCGPDARAGLEQAFQHGLPVEGTVTAANKGGVDVLVAGTRAFCPISQLDIRRVESAEAFVGQTLSFRITRYEEDRRGLNVVVSRRALLAEEARARGAETRAKLAVGSVLPGVVTALKDYGAFVDLGGLEGMLHVSEIGFDRTVRPADVLAVGQRISVQVIRIEKKDDPKRPEQIALSLKALEPDPWLDAAQRFGEGSRVRGTVTRVTPFGAFVELAPGVEGLVHVSELGAGRPLRHARDAVKAGDAIDVTVKAIDREQRRLSLVPSGPDETLDQDAHAAVARAAAPARLGTLGDLLKSQSQSLDPRRAGK